jgi:glycosyltransferase involved in cell wall biosynthesis
MNNLPSDKIAYWAYNYAPQWEAASMEVDALMNAYRDRYDMVLIAQNLNTRTLHLRGNKKSLPLPFSLAALPYMKRLASSVQINHIFASPAEPILLPRIGGHNTILTVTKDADSLNKFEKNLPHLRKLRHIVVESEWHMELLYQAGLNSNTVQLIYPGSQVKPYVPAQGNFKILFATSPLNNDMFLARGIYLILRVAALLPQVQFILTWREMHYDHLKRLIEQDGLTNVEVRNGYIPNMNEVYHSVHATILPGLTSSSLKPAPHSALDSLAHGKPVLISSPSSIAGLIGRNQCGVVFEPSVDSLVQSIRHLMDHYDRYQPNCHPTIEQCFSRQFFLERYGEIYASMLSES